MIIEITRSYIDGIPVGSVCDVVTDNETSYLCLWGSMNGSYYVTVPKDVCKPWKDPMKELRGILRKKKK